MSFYNMLYGVNPAAFIILPMLGKHPTAYPRFRDCFSSDERYPEYDDHIHVYTRTGGNNREPYAAENEVMRQMPGFVTDYDDSFDPTFASWVFTVPEQWKADYFAIVTQNFAGISTEYQEQVKEVYPTLADQIDLLFFRMAKAPA